MTRSKTPLAPLDGKTVKMYVCGPTVYHYAHIGNMRTYIMGDILKRTILYNHLAVQHVMNITDVGHLTSDADEGEDKMQKGAKREGKTVWEIAQFYTDAVQLDMKRLNIIEPNIWCKATDHIKEQIEMIQTLEKKGFTYQTGGNVYFDIQKFPDYGKLARINLEELQAGARIEVDQNKKHPADFALWFTKSKFENQDMQWDSPWGRGYPGWHIECSAMSHKYLGDQFDIHCGGIDLARVHHTNEIAQTEAATSKTPWVNIWMHGEFIVNDKGKMSKSAGEFLTVQSLIDKGYDPAVYRYLCLTTVYRQQLMFSFEAMDSAKGSFESLKSKIQHLHEHKTEGTSKEGIEHKYKDEFVQAINDDLNMPQALAVMWSVLRDDELANERKIVLAESFDEVLGLGVKEMGIKEDIPEEIKVLAHNRHEAKLAKNWALSDELRNKINNAGYTIDDKKDGNYTIRKN